MNLQWDFVMGENRILSLLAVRNFQPYKDVVLEFVNGVNVITGTSDVKVWMW